MTSAQRIAWILARGKQCLANRGVAALDAQAVTTMLDLAGEEYRQEAAEAIRQLSAETPEEAPVE